MLCDSKEASSMISVQQEGKRRTKVSVGAGMDFGGTIAAPGIDLNINYKGAPHQRCNRISELS